MSYTYLCKVPVQFHDHYGNQINYEANSKEIQTTKDYMESCDYFENWYTKGPVRELSIYPEVNEPNYLYFKLKITDAVETEEAKKELHDLVKELEWVLTTMAEFWIGYTGDFQFVSIKKIE